MEIKNLDNKHKDKDCVILACGPSLREYSDEKVRSFCKDKIVICVKESIFEFEDICDYFISNFVRHRDYNIKNKSIVKIHQKGPNSPKNLDQYDILIEEDRPFNINSQLLKVKNYDKYNFKNNIKRPWGPGIMIETVLYLCQYMGINNVFTIGFDLFDVKKETKLVHYFENDNNETYSKSRRYGERSFKDEAIFINKNLPSMIDYFKRSNMNIFVVGKMSFLNPEIKRVYI